MNEEDILARIKYLQSEGINPTAENYIFTELDRKTMVFTAVKFSVDPVINFEIIFEGVIDNYDQVDLIMPRFLPNWVSLNK